MKEKLLSRVSTFQDEMKEWMDVMHQNPELNMDTHETAKFIAGKLKSWGYAVAEGIGGTGIVASMTVGDGKKAIGLRADFDALPTDFSNVFPWMPFTACTTCPDCRWVNFISAKVKPWQRWITGRFNSREKAATAPCPN